MLNFSEFKCSSLITNLRILFILFLAIKAVNSKQLNSKDSEITITINGDGRQQILRGGDCPDYVYINGGEENVRDAGNCKQLDIPINETSKINKVKMVWTSKINSAYDLLKDMPNLIEVDLSRFDSSEITTMDFMFQRDHNLISINFSNFNTSKVTSMECLFYECYNLKELDLSSFDTSKVTQMRLLFHLCHSLTSINLESFDTSNVLNMELMFLQNYNLREVSTKNFNTAKVQNMKMMFSECHSLTSLDLTNFDTSSLTDMESMFDNSYNLKSINLSSFDTSNVKNMKNVFKQCKALDYLDISNFDTSKVNYMDNMFTDCENLKYLNLSNFYTPNLLSMYKMFTNCKSLFSLDISNFDTHYITNMDSMFSGCIKLTTLNISNFNVDSVTSLKNMFENCYKLDYINLHLYDDHNNDDRLEHILDETPQNMVICIEENVHTEKLQYIIYLKICPTIYCGYDWKSKQKKILKNNTCVEYFMVETTEPNIITTEINIESTEIKESTNIIESTEIKESNNIMKSTYIKESTNIIKSTELIQSTEVKEATQVTKSTYIMESTEKIEFKDTTNELNLPQISTNIKINNNNIEETKTFNEITYSYKYISQLSEIINNYNLTSDEINKMIYENITKNCLQNYKGTIGEEIIIEGKNNFYFRATTKQNMFSGIKNDTKKLSKIDLGICEDKLRQKYNLSNDIELIIISMEKETDISYDRNVQFEVYESLNKTKLNLSVCEDITIDIYIPLELSEELIILYNELKELGYNLFDPNDKFYRDICTPYKSENGTDVILPDRFNNYFNNEETKCPSGCKMSDYSMETQNLKCECNIDNNDINIGNLEGSKALYTSFYDVLKYSNYKVLFCYKLAFRLINFKINKGCIIIFIFFVVYLIFLIIYSTKGIRKFKLEIAKYMLVDNNQIRINKEMKDDDKEPKYVNTFEKLKQEEKRKTHQNVDYDYRNIINRSSSKGLNRKSIKRSYRKSTKSVIFPPKKSSRKKFSY